MPLSPDFQKIRKSIQSQYGKEKGTEVYYKWLNKHGFDDTKPMSGQKSKADATADSYSPLLELFDNPDQMDNPDDLQDPSQEARAVPITDGMDRREAGNKAEGVPDPKSDRDEKAPDLSYSKKEVPPPYQKGIKDGNDSQGGGDEKPDASDKTPVQASIFSVPMYKFTYTAAPRPGFEGKDGPIIIKSLVLEEGENVNGWRVDPREFESVAAQYKAGRHLRINHSKNMEDVIGKSFDGKVIKGVDVAMYLGLENAPQGINPNGMYVAAEFEANPREPQVRTNILHGFVDTGSIGLDANAFCAECGKPVTHDADGEMVRSCRHAEATINLRDVDVKEYSYVAEPAFPNTKAFPSFSAAVDSIIRRSSLSQSQNKIEPTMSATVNATVDPTKQAKVDVSAAKKAESDSESDADAAAEALAAKYISYYEKGMKDAGKFRAKADGDSDSDSDNKKSADAAAESDSDADASVKASSSKRILTDQMGVSKEVKAPVQAADKIDLWQVAWHNTAHQLKAGGVAVELFKAAVESPTAPSSVRRFKGARWE